MSVPAERRPGVAAARPVPHPIDRDGIRPHAGELGHLVVGRRRIVGRLLIGRGREHAAVIAGGVLRAAGIHDRDALELDAAAGDRKAGCGRADGDAERVRVDQRGAVGGRDADRRRRRRRVGTRARCVVADAERDRRRREAAAGAVVRERYRDRARQVAVAGRGQGERRPDRAGRGPGQGIGRGRGDRRAAGAGGLLHFDAQHRPPVRSDRPAGGNGTSARWLFTQGHIVRPGGGIYVKDSRGYGR